MLNKGLYSCEIYSDVDFRSPTVDTQTWVH
jgi:hypothetical protein